MFARLIVILTVAFSADVALASSPFPTGNDEALMGNTGIALARSPSGVYYNPGILGTIDSSSISGSASNFYIFSMNGSAGRINNYNAVPSTLVASWKLGSGTLAVSVITTNDIDVTYNASSSVDGFEYAIEQRFQTSLYGVSWGQSLFTCGEDCRISGGLSLFLDYSTANINMQLSTSSATQTTSENEADSAATFSLMPMLGLFVETSKNFSIGFRLTAPSILLATNETGLLLGQTYTSSPTPTNTPINTTPATALPSIPRWGGGIGTKWTVTPSFDLLSDLSINEEERGPNTSLASTKLSVGGDYHLNDRWSLLAGSTLDPSYKLGSIPPGSASYDTLMTTVGLKWVKDALESSVGIYEIRNLDVQNPANPGPIPTFNVASLNVFGVIISGMYRFQ